jgi:hypothetical protein
VLEVFSHWEKGKEEHHLSRNDNMGLLGPRDHLGSYRQELFTFIREIF